MISKSLILVLCFAFYVLSGSLTQASLIGWSAELNRNGNFAIDNQSTGAFSIKSITFDLTGTSGGVTLDSSAVAMLPTGTIGSFNTVVSDPTLIDFTSPGGLSNDLPFIKSTIGTAGNLFTFNFEAGSFASLEGWGLDNMVFNRSGGGTVTRANMSGARISVLFWEYGTSVESTYSVSPANGGSFPIQATAVPEPSSLAICAMSVLIVGSIGRRRRK